MAEVAGIKFFVTRVGNQDSFLVLGLDPTEFPARRLTLVEGRRPDASALHQALLWTASRPGRGILRNALLFAAAFSVMLFAPLTPYVTVGAFIMTMMLLSALFTLLLLPALITLSRHWLFRDRNPAEAGEPVAEAI